MPRKVPKFAFVGGKTAFTHGLTAEKRPISNNLARWGIDDAYFNSDINLILIVDHEPHDRFANSREKNEPVFVYESKYPNIQEQEYKHNDVKT